jgi:hypothetical protein
MNGARRASAGPQFGRAGTLTGSEKGRARLKRGLRLSTFPQGANRRCSCCAKIGTSNSLLLYAELFKSNDPKIATTWFLVPPEMDGRYILWALFFTRRSPCGAAMSKRHPPKRWSLCLEVVSSLLTSLAIQQFVTSIRRRSLEEDSIFVAPIALCARGLCALH